MKPLRYLSPIHKSSRQIGVYFERELEGTGILPQEGHLLSYLRSYAPCPVGELVAVFGLRGSTATSVLDRMEERGLIARRDNPEDRRSFLLELTAEGRRLAGLVQGYVEKLESGIRRRVSAADEEGFKAVMAAIAAATEVKIAGGLEAAKARRKPSSRPPRSRKR
ncbi:MAG TPA: MarR family transcriptional regulator [Thermoanaerobaculia bacterium]